MKRMTVTRYALAMLLTGAALQTAGCLTLEFGYTHTSDEYVIKGSQSDEPAASGKEDYAGGAQAIELTSGYTDLSLELSLDGVMDQLDDLRMTGFRLERTATSLTSGDRDDLSFLERVDLYVIGHDGLPSFLMATYDRERDGYALDVLPLTMHEQIGLRLYAQKGLELYVLLRGSLPTDDVSLRVAADFDAVTSP